MGGNVVLCCDIVNRMKLNMSVEDFVSLVDTIYKNQNTKKEVHLAKAI